ncbi:uncharacterized protein [Lolium perenne]|nr:uncharacterized protein LOC127314503 [Lolium perenne]
MGCKLSRAGEGPGCDKAAAAAAGTSSDCGDAATRRSALLTPSTSPPPAPTPSSPSPPPAPTPSSTSPPAAPTPSSPTASSPSPSTSSPSPSRPQSPSPTPSSLLSADESSTSTPSSTSSTDEEDLWEEEFLQSIEITHPQEDERGEEQEVDPFLESLGTTHLTSTRSQMITENDDSGGVSNSRFKLGHKELVLTLDNYDNDIITEKIMLLSKKYGFFRRVPGDGSCFYRAFIFNYLENTVEIKDDDNRKTEAARLRQRVETYMLACYRYDEDLLPAFCGFESVVSLIEQGLAAGELYHMEMTEHVTSQILPLLRSLTEIEIRMSEDYYHAFLPGDYESVSELCIWEVRAEDGEANHMQIRALVDALGIPLILENLDGSSPVRLNPHHIYPSQESKAEELEQSIDSDDTTTPMAHVEREGSRNLSPAERRRLVTLLYRPGHYDIIYPK